VVPAIYGHCKDLDEMLKYHNLGKVKFTKSKRPWKVFYFEEFQTKSEACKRELYFKSRNGYRFLKKEGII
jgi:putative endonuclease